METGALFEEPPAPTVETDAETLPRLEALCEQIVLDVFAADAQPKYRPQANYASKAGHACPFFLYAQRVYYADLPAPTPDLLGIFRTGREIEEAVVADLKRGGFSITHQQVPFEDTNLELRGRIDGFINHLEFRKLLESRGHKLKPNWQGVPMEIKGLHPSYFDACTSFHAMLTSSRSWVRMYPRQTLLYGFMANEPLVCMVLRDKASRKTRFKFAWVDSFMKELERIGETLAKVNLAVRTGVPPQPIIYDSTWCDRCDAAALCPTMMELQGNGKVSIDDSPELAELLETMAESKPHRQAFDAAERRIKALFDATGHKGEKDGTKEVIISGDYFALLEYKNGKRFISVKRNGTPVEDATTSE